MKRTNRLNIQSCSHFQKILHLFSVFSYDTDEVTARFIIPIFFHIQSAKFSKTIRRKEYFVGTVISNHNFRPVNHRCKYKRKHMFSQSQGFSVLHFQHLSFQIHAAEEILHHHKSLGICHYCRIWICFHKIMDISCMIRLHMLYDQIIWCCSIQSFCHIIQPFVSKSCIYRIHNSNFFILDHVRIVSHPIRNHILSLKKIYLMVIYTHVKNVIRNLH